MNTYFPIYSFEALLEAALQKRRHFKVLWERVTKLSPELVADLLRKQERARLICQSTALVLFGMIVTKSGLGPWYYKVILLTVMWATLRFINDYFQKKYRYVEIERIRRTFGSFFEAFSDGAMIDPDESGPNSVDTIMMSCLVFHHLTAMRNNLRFQIALDLRLAHCETEAALTDLVRKIAEKINPTSLLKDGNPMQKIREMLTKNGFNARTKTK